MDWISLLCLESIQYVCLPPHFWKVFPPLCVVVPVAVASILPLSLCHPVFCFAIVLTWGRALPLNRNAKIKAWVEEGNCFTSCKLRKGKSHPSCFHVGCLWGYMLIISNYLGLLGDEHHFCIVLCGTHCLDHAGCQGCCCDTNDIWEQLQSLFAPLNLGGR